MLEPRLSGVSDTMGGQRNFGSISKSFSALLCCVIFLSTIVSCQDINTDPIETYRIKREGVPENRDLTVLLVNDHQKNDYSTKLGRYHSVKPLIGLITSTARTFIQDGVTTEFATQILGTTLDNGRIYAQLLTKSSLVLYNKPSNVDDTELVQPTQSYSFSDGQWNVKQDLGFINPEQFAIKNTDYIAPTSKMDIVYASKPSQNNVKFWNSPGSSDNIDENQILEEPVGRRVQQFNEIPKYNAQNEAFNFLDGPAMEKENIVLNPSIIENANTLHRQSKAFESIKESVKLDINDKTDFNESTVTKVKPNYDLPTFTIKNEFSPIFYYIDNVETRNSHQQTQQSKLPKKLFGQKSEPRPKKTFTYAGFADFTTVVGDSVIIFTPNTDTAQNPGEVNIFPSANKINNLNTKITFLASDIPVATATYKENSLITPSKIPYYNFGDIQADQVAKNENESNKKPLGTVKVQSTNSIGVQLNNGLHMNFDVIQPSESIVDTTESTRTTDDLILSINTSSFQATEPLNDLKPTAIVSNLPKDSISTQTEISDSMSQSEEEINNVAAEVTDKNEYYEEADTTTTESGYSEETFDEYESTTENKQEVIEPVCSKDLLTLSTMTTAFKTLTYLTTYFIPLESTETTTSVKSDVVVESTVGYLTNVVCSSAIEPTRVLSEQTISTESAVQNFLEYPKLTTVEEITESVLLTTIKSETVTEKDIPLITVSEDSTVIKNESSTAPINTIFENNSTTTESVSTSQTRMEVSVSTESSNTLTTEKSNSEDIIDTNENEIDLIYKTLYTTYTYFTTFFGDQTSSVASHKSVVTNIITSTINLSNLDPSLLGAFDEGEIAPTNVGIGRPTESYIINSAIDLVKNKDLLESVEFDSIYNSRTPTPAIGDDVLASIKPDAVQTYFTTYTFFTTIFVGSDANICSRNEVYTNFVGPDELVPTKSNLLTATRAQFDFRNCKQVKRDKINNTEQSSSLEKSVTMESKEEKSNDIQPNAVKQNSVEVDMLFSVESNPLESENLYDVKSSSSKGERKLLENNNVLEDQISSESNIDEIMPSPTLLLQTSYTTFTYFTTMYVGKDSSNVKSRLETITNVVTETITPKKETEEENYLPITYYTTFTYWTTLYKDKSTTITSREEIVSNVVTPAVQTVKTASPIDTTPIDIDGEFPPKELEVELKPSLAIEKLEREDDKATFYTTYTYFTTFYAGNSSQIRSSLETVTNIVENSKLIEDNQLGRKVPTGSGDKNLIQDNGEKPRISPTIVKEEIQVTKLPDLNSVSPTVILGTYIDNLFAEVKTAENKSSNEVDKKILYSQVAVISGESTVVTNDNKILQIGSGANSTSSTLSLTENTSVSPDLIQSSVIDIEPTTENHLEAEDDDDGSNTRKKSRLSFTAKKPSFTPVIIPFASRNRPTFSPKRVPILSSATTITRADATPTITATPSLKSVRPSNFGGSRKSSTVSASPNIGRRFNGRNSVSSLSSNFPSPSRSSGFSRGSIQPSSRKTGFRTNSIGKSSILDISSRSAAPRIRPTASIRLRNGRQSVSVSLPPVENSDFETQITQLDETSTEPISEATEATVKTTNNPLLRFRRPPVSRQPGTSLVPRSTSPAPKRNVPTRGRLATTTKRTTTTRTTGNPLLSLRRQRPNSLFPKRNLFKQPEPEPEEEIKQNEQDVGDSEEINDSEDFNDNDYESSDKKEQLVSTPATPPPKKNPNTVQIKPFAFRRRNKRQIDYGNRKYTNFRRPGVKPTTSYRAEPDAEPETEAPVTQRHRSSSRFTPRPSSGIRTTTVSTPRQPFIIRGESRTTTQSSNLRRNKSSRPSISRTTTASSRLKAPRLQNDRRSSSSRTTSRSRTRTTTSRGIRHRGSYENTSGERLNHNKYNTVVNDGKITVTHQIPTDVTIPVVNGKITEYKNIITAKPSIETLMLNQVSTSIGPLGNQQLILASEATELSDNGATKIIKFILHETPTTTVIFTPTTIRGRKTSYSHIIPSTVYNVEPVTQTISPEINANVPLANLLLSQLLLGNQQPAINPLLAYQGQGLIPQQQIMQTPFTEYKIRSTTYVTTVTDNRETVIPLTFKGKAILTTIVDPTTNVITATEFVTDTVVTTPTAVAQSPQFNSLLLPLLLQQQQQQQQALALPLQTANPLQAFNTIGIVYDNTPWKPGKEIESIDKANIEEDERKLKNLATRILSNGVEVLVKDKNAEEKFDQRRIKYMHMPELKQTLHHASSTAQNKKSLLSSAVATVFHQQQISASFPLQLMQHNYIIKTCMTTYTYLTTVVQNKRSAISTFETIVSVITTESLTNYHPQDFVAGIKPTKTLYSQVKTIQPSIPIQIYQSNLPKINKRIDDDDDNSGYELIQPSEVGHFPCTSSCSCSDTKTESLKTNYIHHKDSNSVPYKYIMKTTKLKATKLDAISTTKENFDKNSQYGPYEYDNGGQLTPTDRIVEKYTEVISDYSDDKSTLEESELLTNEQAPVPFKSSTKAPEKIKNKHPKPNKNKFAVADLLKLGSLSIKGLSQLAPVIEKMTGGFIRRQDAINKSSTTTLKPETVLTPYNVNKRVDSQLESKHGSFPIYIPVDEMETSESQLSFSNATLHQNLAWAVDHKYPKINIVPPKLVHESPLVNGGIPISPGEVITANSDVIVGKPAVGGPLTLAASGMKLPKPKNRPPIDSFVASSEPHAVKEKLQRNEEFLLSNKADDSFDLRPPNLPNSKIKPSKNFHRPTPPYHVYQNKNIVSRPPTYNQNEQVIPTEDLKSSGILSNHGRPVFLDYIPSFGKVANKLTIKEHVNIRPISDESDEDDMIFDNRPSSSEVVNSKVAISGHPQYDNPNLLNKPFLVDIQPSKVANVLIPHGSSTALVFAGSSEPHKTGDYIDDPLPYPEPGYFGSFSIDAPQMTNVHNVAPNNNKHVSDHTKPQSSSHNKGIFFKNEINFKHNDKRPTFSEIPPPTSNQEKQVQVGPAITAYNPDYYRPSINGLEKFNGFNENNKGSIDNEYENHLAVPPPPPKSSNQDLYHTDKNKHFNQRPIVHMKPVQDMKVFLNVQHPIPNTPKYENNPGKVTSEIYFASQAPNSQTAPMYTFHIPPAKGEHSLNQKDNKNYDHISRPKEQQSNQSGHAPEDPNKSLSSNAINNPENTYTVTLNTATNVASTADFGQIVSSNVPTSINDYTNEVPNKNIPIGTNYVIKVEDDLSVDRYKTNPNQNQNIKYDGIINKPSEEKNNWEGSNSNGEIGININSYHDQAQQSHPFVNVSSQQHLPSSINSHANFPMIHDNNFTNKSDTDIKPVNEYSDDIKLTDQKRPGKLIPNIPTNSHGWYSSFPFRNNEVINNIKLESTTRKIIPLNHDFDRNVMPEFGQKIASVGKPPTEFYRENSSSPITHFGRPFSKAQENKISTLRPTTFDSKYIPSSFSSMKQPAYDIPIKDYTHETTTSSNENYSKKVPSQYENSEEVFDGEEEIENNNTDGQSQESMKVPIISTSSNTEHINKETTELTLLQDEILLPTINTKTEQNLHAFNSGTQTEKPFGIHSDVPSFQSNSMKPIFNSNKINTKPRPFTITTALDHQLQQPHWQINELMINSTNISNEDSSEMNTGTSSTTHPTAPYRKVPFKKLELETKYKRPQRPVFSVRFNNSQTTFNNNIAASTVKSKENYYSTEKGSIESISLPTTTMNLELNRSSSEIINLSPPPPTIDYNFRPSSNDEMIMGMSPPPQHSPTRLSTRTPQTPRPVSYPQRTPPPFRTPPRNLPTRLPSQRFTKKPASKDDISTYRPSYDTNFIKRPISNMEQPSSQLLPPPKEKPSNLVPVNNKKPSVMVDDMYSPSVIFPTPISSGWLTSSGVEFSSSFDFAPTSVQFSETIESTYTPITQNTASDENTERTEEENISSTEKLVTNNINLFRETTLKSPSKISTTYNDSKDDSETNESSQEEFVADKVNIIPIRNKSRTRKPYPIRTDEKKSSTKLIPRPTKINSHFETLHPTRLVPSRKIEKPSLAKPELFSPSNVIESSESTLFEDVTMATEVISDLNPISTSLYTNEVESQKPSTSTNYFISSNIKPHYDGNEVKITDEILTTKTEFRTTVVTHTKILSEPPTTISSVGFINLTHTLTVTHTKTSLVSQSEGAITETLVLTNTQTSTIVDVITEIHTQVQPTTIRETVTKHIPASRLSPTPVIEATTKTKASIDDVTMSSEEENNFIIKGETTETVQKITNQSENDSDTFFVVMNKSQNGGLGPTPNTNIETDDFDGITRNEQVNSNGVSQVLFGEILLAGAPYLETTNINDAGYGKECQPDCKASRNERCQRIDGMMKCVCRPGFARMFPDRPCKPTYTYSVKLVLNTNGKERLIFQDSLADNSSHEYQSLAVATHEGITRMVMQSDLRDVYHGVHITGFHPVEIIADSGEIYQGVMNEFYVQLSDNAHESRLKEVLEKYLRNNNYSLGGTEVFASGELMDKLQVNDFDECVSGQFHDCSEHAQCFNLRGTYTCSCLEGYADLSVSTLYPGRICSAEPVGCAQCNYHGACYSRDDTRLLCECFQWHAGSSCQFNLKVVLIGLGVCGALLVAVLAVSALWACRAPRRRPRDIVTCIQAIPTLPQGALPSKLRADRRALISDRHNEGDGSSVHNASLPYMPSKRQCGSRSGAGESPPPPPAHAPPPPPPAVCIPRARLHGHHESRDNLSRKKSMELSSEAKLISYLESGATNVKDEMRRKHSMESSYSAPKDRQNKPGALVSAGFKVSTTIRPEESIKTDRDDLSSINKGDLDAELARLDSLRKNYSQDDNMSVWTNAEKHLGELTLSEARSVGGTLPTSTGRAASSTRLTHQEANTMAERDLGSTFLLPHVHLYKPDITSDVSEFDSL